MADQFIQVPADSTGKKVDASELTVGANTVERQRIVIAADATAAALAAVKNSTAQSGDYGLVARNIPRKEGQTLSTANLGISGVFTQAFQDSTADGVLFVEAAARADVASATNGFIIQESDDSADANFTRTVAAVTVSANTLTVISAVIRARYWRVQYTNGGTAQTSFRLTAAPSVLPLNAAALINYDTTSGNVQQVPLCGIALPAAGGPVAGGTATNPVRTDPTGTTSQPAVGNVADGAAEAGNALKVGGRAATTIPTAVADAQRVSEMFDKFGHPIVRLNAPREQVVQNTITLSTVTETTLIAAGAAGVFRDLTHLTLSNTSGTAVRVDIRDATAGTVRYSIFLAASGGGAVSNFTVPFTQATAASAWTAQLSAAVTDVRITAQAIEMK